MNQQRQPKLAQLLRRFKHVIHADDGLGVRRRDLRSSREGDVQLELDFGDPRGAFNRQKWFEGVAGAPTMPR